MAKKPILNMPIDFKLPSVSFDTSAIHSISEQMKKVTEEFNAIREQMSLQYDTVFRDVTKQLFSKHKALKIIQWTQYTPYFNDGDVCNFGINEISYSVEYPEGIDGSTTDFDTHFDSYDGAFVGEPPSDFTYRDAADYKRDPKATNASWKRYAADTVDAFEEICKKYDKDELIALSDDMALFRKMVNDNQSFMEMMLGDHVLVTVTKNGVFTSEYDHD